MVGIEDAVVVVGGAVDDEGNVVGGAEVVVVVVVEVVVVDREDAVGPPLQAARATDATTAPIIETPMPIAPVWSVRGFRS